MSTTAISASGVNGVLSRSKVRLVSFYPTIRRKLESGETFIQETTWDERSISSPTLLTLSG